MKKTLTLVLALVMVIACLSVAVFADEETAITVKSATFESSEADVVKEVPRGGAKDNACLYDGDDLATASGFETKGIVLIQNTKCTVEGAKPQYSYILELSEEADISAVKVVLYTEYRAMIGWQNVDDKVAVNVSSDGTDYSFVGDYTLDAKSEDYQTYVIDNEISLGKIVTGKFVKLTFTFTEGPHGAVDNKCNWEWHGFTELGVVAEAATGGLIDDNSKEEPSTETSSTPAPAVKEYKFSFTVDGAKKYIDIVPREDKPGSVNVVIVDEPANAFRWNEEFGVYTVTIDGVEFYIGTYNNYSTFSGSNVSYISGENAHKVGVSQFPAKFVKNGDKYVLTLHQTNLDKDLYFTGAMDGFYFAASENIADAAAITIEVVGGDEPIATGDAGLIIFSVISVLSLAGVAVIKKRK